MADASSTSSALTAVAATTSATTKRVSPSARTRASSPDAYTASTPINRTTSAALIRATKCTNYNNRGNNNNKKHSCSNTCTMHHTHDNCWTSSKLSCLAEPVTSSPVTKEQMQARTTKNTIFSKIPLIRGCLLFHALALP